MAEGTEEKAEYQVLLSENYALDTDKLNLVLKERYEKREGKGKFARVVEGEYGWRELGYFRDMAHVADYIVKHELLKEHETGELRDIAERIEDVRDSIIGYLVEKVTVIRNEGKREKDADT